MAYDDAVGYGRPPKQTRFRQGESGNPKGRPRGTRNLKTELEQEMRQPILVREGNKQMRITKRHAVIKSQLAKAIRGDTRAAAWVFEIVGRLLDPDSADGAGTGRQLPVDDQAILADYAVRLAAGRDTTGSPEGHLPEGHSPEEHSDDASDDARG
jgi:hypothetical protein